MFEVDFNEDWPFSLLFYNEDDYNWFVVNRLDLMFWDLRIGACLKSTYEILSLGKFVSFKNWRAVTYYYYILDNGFWF